MLRSPRFGSGRGSKEACRTGEDGSFEIAHVPAGVELVIELKY